MQWWRKAARMTAAGAAVIAVACFLLVREEERVVQDFVDRATAGVPRQDVEATVLTLSRAIFARTNRGIPAAQLPFTERLLATSFFNVGTTIALKYGIYGVVGQETYGPCGTMSRILLNACWRIGIPARKLQLLPGLRSTVTHTLVEFRSGDRWLVISPSDSSFVWRLADGRIATREEIQADSLVFAQVYRSFPHYPVRFDHPSNIRWEKLPPPLRGAFRLALGERGYAEAETPRLYDRHRLLFLYLSLILLGVSLAVALIGAPHEPRRA